MGLTLITGGTGMLGSALARLLLERGSRIRITYLPGDTTLALGGLESVEHRPADLLDPAGLVWALEGVDTLFHTAALVSFKPALYSRQMAINVEGTRLLLRLAAAAGVKRLVYTSTVNTLGIPPAGTMGDEGTPSNWSAFHLGYMDSKLAAERLVLEERQLEAVAVLPGTLFGPGDAHVNAGSYVRLVARTPLLLAPPGGTTVAHVDDVALGHLLALERGRAGRRYVLGGEAMSYAAIFTSIARALGCRPRVGVMPRAPLQCLGRLGSLGNRLGLSLPLTEGLMVAACSQLYYSSALAQQELGWSYRPGAEAIRDAVLWYRRLGWV